MKKNVLSHRTLDRDMEIDWAFDYSILGLNLSTMQFENVSYITKGATIALNIYYNTADHSEEIADEGKRLGADYFLYIHNHYTRNHYVVGYVKL